jgi:uncharacterized coiled-coil protein SlyX
MAAAVAVLLFGAGCASGYSLGWLGRTEFIRELKTGQAGDQKTISDLTSQLSAKQTAIDKLTDELKQANAKLDDIFQSTRQITLTANQAQRVSIGGFTVGLGTGLGSGSVIVNINGKQQNMAAGDSQNLAFNCRIELQSFEVQNSSAIVDTSCSPASSSNTTAK